MDHKIFFISDIEMGRRDAADDFSDDDVFARFLEEIRQKNPGCRLTLVLNGDIFDFLKMSYKGSYPRYITEEISLWKMEEVIRSHPGVFEALRRFLAVPSADDAVKNEVHFVIGNHDADLSWRSLQARLWTELGSQDRVFFDFHFENEEIHAEHGHLQDPFFIHDSSHPIVKFRGREILDLPWGSQAVFSHLVKLKHRYPDEERQYPKPLVFERNHNFKKDTKKVVWDLALKSILFGRLLHPCDPTYKVPYGSMIKHTLKYGFDFADDERFIRDRVREVVAARPHKKIIVLGHAHVRTETEVDNTRVFVTDTWRNEVDIRENRKKAKTYVEVSYADGELMKAQMKTFEV